MRFEDTTASRLDIIPDFISSQVEKLYYLPLDEDAIFKIRLSLQEAVVNAAKHGNKMDPSKEVRVVMNVDARSVVIEVTDQGAGFNARRLPDPTRPENISKLCGRGVFLIRHLMHDVRFLDEGRTIRMTIRLKKERRGKVEIRTRKVDDSAVILLDGEVNVQNCAQLRETFKRLIDEGQRKVIADFASLTFIDSSGLAVIIEADQKLKQSGGKLRIYGVNRKIRGIFEVTKIHKMIGIYDSQESALKDF